MLPCFGVIVSTCPMAFCFRCTATIRIQKKLRNQLAASMPLKKQLWKQTVAAKIENQAALLDQLGYQSDRLKKLVKGLLAGDPDNREGQAAAHYWSCVLHPYEGITRGRFEDAPEPPFQLWVCNFTFSGGAKPGKQRFVAGCWYTPQK